MKELIIKLAPTDREALGNVRTHKQLLAAIDEEWIWLRGIELKETIEPTIRQLPAKNTYEMDEEGNLFPLHGLTPVGKLKSLNWLPIARYIPVELPTSAMPAQIGQLYTVRLVQSSKVREGQALLTTLPLWAAYASTTPEARLKKLRFAVSDENEVLILGTPLPSLPGKEYWMQENMLLPAGYDFELPWIAELIASKLNPLNDGIILFAEDSSWEIIQKESFVWATRSAVRLTERNKLHE